MQARVRTVAFQGVDVLPVDVQVMIAPGQLAFAMVGLADKAVGESRERVRAALRALGLALPPQLVTVNLSPADLLKEGSHYDLPIALALLAAMGVLAKESIAGFVVLGAFALGLIFGGNPNPNAHAFFQNTIFLHILLHTRKRNAIAR